MKKLRRFKRHGFSVGSSLVEIVVATGVMALVLTAIVAGLTLSLKTSAESEYRVQATKRAQEAMEVFRRERTLLGWDEFTSNFTNGATYCLQELPAPREVFEDGECSSEQSLVVSGLDLYREAEVSFRNFGGDDPELVVTVTVVWNDGRNDKSVNLVQGFRRWE